MSVPQKYAKGAIQNTDKFCVIIVTDHHVDKSSFLSLKVAKRAFNVYQWKNNLKGSNGDIFSGWCPWLHFARSKWTKYDKTLYPDKIVGPPMMKAHVFFDSFEKFKKWLTEEEYRALLTDLI